MTQKVYTNIEEIESRKEELRQAIRKEGETLSAGWYSLIKPQKASTKGEFVANIINNGIVAYDAFMLVRKLMKQYNNLFGRKK